MSLNFPEKPLECNRCGGYIPKTLIACPHCIGVVNPKPRIRPEKVKPDVDGLFDASTPPIQLGTVIDR